MSDERWWLGIDVGGTFTDLVAVSRTTGEVKDLKVLTTRPRQEEGVLEAVRATGIAIEQIDEIVHGHTQGINAVLSRQGAKTALLATAGHRDLLDLGRMDREFGPRLYDPTWLRPHQDRPVVRRRDRFGVRERMGYDGQVVKALDEDQVYDIAQELKRRAFESVAICFINSYVNPAHEQRVAEIVAHECPDIYIQTSALYPVTKEHERTTTVVFDAYVGPTVTGYLRRLETSLDDLGFSGTLWIMTMNGGVGSVEETSKAPVFQLVSGPVGGVSGAVDLARAYQEVGQNGNFLTMDVGGTSTDVAALKQGQTPLTDLWTVEHGLIMTMPAVDVQSVGSGAGSLIHLDPHGALSVGPESAGSTPGPACYGRGGARPTVTDACVQLGILQPDLFAGGAITLDVGLAEAALKSVADPLGMTVTELADGAYRLACSDMASALRSISTFRGLDLRGFSLLAFGAAGPMMAVQVARELGLASVVVPAHSGEFSAYGLVASDLRVTKAKSPLETLTAMGPEKLEATFRELEGAAIAELKRQGVAREDVTLTRDIFAMYSGQSWDNRLQIEGGLIDDGRIKAITDQVHAFYIDTFGFSAEELPILITTVEITAAARRPALPRRRPAEAIGESLIRYRDSLTLAGRMYVDVPIHDRMRIGAQQEISGPAVIVEAYATTVIDADSVARVDELGNLTITLNAQDGDGA